MKFAVSKVDIAFIRYDFQIGTMQLFILFSLSNLLHSFDNFIHYSSTSFLDNRLSTVLSLIRVIYLVSHTPVVSQVSVLVIVEKCRLSGRTPLI